MSSVTSKDNSARPPSAPSSSQRLVSLDQFRGYTVVGMLLVNYFGGYQVCPQVLEHTNDYCSYADTIMPQFLFAVGFALRLTFGRRMQTQGSFAAYGRMIRRLLGLVLISVVIYNVSPRAANWEQLSQMTWVEIFGEPMKRGWYQTLMHIAVTSLWILPVVQRPPKVRILWMLASGGLHVALSYWFNFAWTNTAPNAIDGGPLGFLTWCIPAIVGTLACDYFVPPKGEVATNARGRSTRYVLLWSAALMLSGYALSCGTRLYDFNESQPGSQAAGAAATELVSDPVWPTPERWKVKIAEAKLIDWFAEPPFVKPPEKTLIPPAQSARKWNYWMMSQRAGTLSYLVFTAGFSLLVFSGFYVACDVYKWHLPVFRTFGTNALVAYIIHMLVDNAVQPFFPKDSPVLIAYLGLAIYFLVTWLFVKQLEKQGAFLKV